MHDTKILHNFLLYPNPFSSLGELIEISLMSKWNTLNFGTIVDFDFPPTCKPFKNH